MDTSVLRVLAIALIANSHLEVFYPFRPLAADGLIGNSLFFMLSGLGLSLSPRIGEGRFIDWHRRRLSRIYPSLWLTVAAGMIVSRGAWREWSALDAVRSLVWPTPYAFIAQIVCFYPAFYLLKSARNPRVEFGVSLGLIGPYAAVAWYHYDLHILSWIFYFQVMLFGGLLAARVGDMRRDGSVAVAVLAPALLVYIAVKLAMVTGRIPMHIAALHALTYPILWGLLALCAAAPAQAIARHPRLSPALGLVAGLTLEIYLVHDFVRRDPRVLMLAFPVNIVAFWAATVPMAWAVAAASDRARRLLRTGSRPRPGPFHMRPIMIGASPETGGRAVADIADLPAVDEIEAQGREPNRQTWE